MEIGQSYITVQVIYQKFVDSPFYYDIKSDILISNPNLQKRWKMPNWHITNLFMIPFITFSVFHLISLQKFPLQEVAEEVVVYIVLANGALLPLTTCLTIERHPIFLALVTTETLRAGGIRYKGIPFLSKRVPKFPEVFEYGIVAGFYIIAMIAYLFPLLREYDPFSLLVSKCFSLPSFSRRVIASACLGSMVLSCIPTIAQELLLMASAIVVFGKLLGEVEKLNANENHEPEREDVDWFQRLVYRILQKLPWSKVYPALQKESENHGNKAWQDNCIITPVFRNNKEKRDSSIAEKFKEQLHFHNQLYIIMTGCNYGGKWFFPLLAFLGISVSVAMSYAVIMLYGVLELPLYLVACLMETITLILILFFAYHGAKPLILSTNIIDFWKAKKMDKAEMKRVEGMLPIACMLGNFFTAKKDTALDIMSTILDFTVSFIVTK